MKINNVKIIKLEFKDKIYDCVEDLQKGDRWELDVQFSVEAHIEPYIAQLMVRYLPEQPDEVESDYELLGVYLLNDDQDQVSEIKEQLDEVHNNLNLMYANLLQAPNIDFEKLYVALETSLKNYSSNE